MRASYDGNVQRRAVLFLAILVLLVVPGPASRTVAAGPTIVSGPLTDNTTWDLAGSPYIVTGDVTVPVGLTLTVQPGVQVRFDTTTPGAHSIIVNGRIVSVGQPGLHAMFTSNDPLPDRNNWASIRIFGPGSVIEYTEFSWGSTTIDIEQSSPKIANNTILESGVRAIQIIGPNAAPLIENNAIQTEVLHQLTGIIVQGADPVIRNNALTDNFFGILAQLGGHARIENNTIRNGWRGLVAISASPYVANNTIEGNGIENVGGSGIILIDSATTLLNNVIQNNGVGVEIHYDAKETLALSRGNVVNGVPLKTLYRYRVRDLVIDGLQLDSGRAAGYHGNATQEGLLTFYDSVNVTVKRAQLENNEALVYAGNSSVTVENSTLSNTSNAFLVTGVSQVMSVNNTFQILSVNVTDQRSTLTIKNFLHVRALSEASTPLEDVRVRVWQDGAEIGTGTTDADGWRRWTVAAYGVISRVGGPEAPQSLTRSTVEVGVDRPGTAFRDTPRAVNMSSTRTAIFFAMDRTPPHVVTSNPAPDSVGVRFASRITISFSEAMNRTATEAAIVVLGYHTADFRWSIDGREVSFAIPDAEYGASYFVEVRDGATDLAGNHLETTYVFTFDLERAPRRVDLTPIWISSLVLLSVGLAAVVWRSRSRAKSLREEESGHEEKREA